MGNLLVRRFKQWCAQAKQGGAVRDTSSLDMHHDAHVAHDGNHHADVYYEFEFVIDTPSLPKESTKKHD